MRSLAVIGSESILALMGPTGLHAAVRCVSPDVGGCFATIQAAITAASGGDTVLVAAGTYPETIDFLGKSVAVLSSSGPGLTILDGGGISPVASMVVPEGLNPVLEGPVGQVV